MSKNDRNAIATSMEFLDLHGELFVFPFILYSVFALITGDYHRKQVIFLITVFSLFVYIFVAIALVLKKRNRIHIIWFEKIPNILVLYYLMAYNFAYILLKSTLSLPGFEQVSAIEKGIVVANLSILLVSYQVKPWLIIDLEKRKNRVEKLRKKAKLTISEWNVVQSMLLVDANERKKPNRIWKLIEWIIVLGLAAILNVYAVQIADILQNIISP